MAAKFDFFSSKEMIETLANMGFSENVVKAVLHKFEGDINKSINILTKNPDKIAQILEEYENEYECKHEQKCVEEHQKTEEAIKRMEEDLGDEEDYLDISLEEESTYLEKYEFLLKE